MNKETDIFDLLHDTNLKDINFFQNKIFLFFSFYSIDNKEYIVELQSEQVTDISCKEGTRIYRH